MSKISADDLNAFFAAHFEKHSDIMPEITLAEPDHVIMKAPVDERNLRPPNFINGPTQMMLADHCAYVVIFTRLGITPMAVTSNLNIDFLRPCLGEHVIVEGKMIKLGRSLAVISVEMKGSENDKISSRATVTYMLPAST